MYRGAHDFAYLLADAANLLQPRVHDDSNADSLTDVDTDTG